ncbi:HAD family hydrolase [Nitrosomonas ureae]|uniref:Haloacid dehalogenase superfamily, subfamily IA, variant 1 with third motif having Dx(3-4)D or Dx(3-4)E n=1 Tax=Nitrosomonas ureae TaxID=44577 RepID=A0A286A9R1_9PROT|nr:HAD-IA family hydrolase [Nitrosomonas ureae]SOD18577.1 haloacid dehalogenase superfamily, subfamily IA, variant 1 with third motif having Dx(3-4)D or Dx(3-4)E [Nitrosomonas ureae]
MTNHQFLRKVLRYQKTYGAKATIKRSINEIFNRMRRSIGHSHPHQALFDRDALLARIEHPNIRLVIFDIFDTLITRPLLDPENTKHWIAKRINCDRYPERRHAAEMSLREAGSEDVSLVHICTEYVRLFGTAEGDAQQLQSIEESIELALAQPLPGMIEVLKMAQQAGKKVVLASDMFLSSDVIKKLLQKCNILEYDTLYLSSEVGVRKSTGELFHHIAENEQILPEQAIMIGDHPVSDQQIPQQLGFQIAVLENPLALAAYFPRLNTWIEKVKSAGPTADELVLGNIVRTFFQVQPRQFLLDRASLTQCGRYGIGYAIVGPLLVAFSEWLIDQANADNIDRLFFLAREGQLMKDIHEVLTAGHNTPQSNYLVLSRRAVSVAMIRSHDDILAIARTDYQANSLSEFLLRRFGLTLDHTTLKALEQRGIWSHKRLVEIQAGQIDDALLAVLETLSDAIHRRAAMEREPMLSYLQQIKLTEGVAALVDVGYAGTIQGRLCDLLERKIQGYYMVTRAAAAEVRTRHGVRIAGCFGEDLATPDQSPLLRYNVPLEMFMGSDDPQISHYRYQDNHAVAGVYNPLSEAEKASIPLRSELRAGALAFARDYRSMKESGLGKLRIDPHLVVDIFRDFWEGASEFERAQIISIATDDYYCGMGIVHFATFLPH